MNRENLIFNTDTRVLRETDIEPFGRTVCSHQQIVHESPGTCNSLSESQNTSLRNWIDNKYGFSEIPIWPEDCVKGTLVLSSVKKGPASLDTHYPCILTARCTFEDGAYVLAEPIINKQMWDTEPHSIVYYHTEKSGIKTTAIQLVETSVQNIKNDFHTGTKPDDISLTEQEESQLIIREGVLVVPDIILANVFDKYELALLLQDNQKDDTSE